MNKNGQITTGLVISAAIVLIVAIILFQASAENIGGVTTTGTWNTSTKSGVSTGYALTAAGTVTVLTGQELLSTPAVWNQNGSYDCSSNVTIAEGVSTTTGTKRILMTTNAGIDENDLGYCTNVNVSYEYAPEGYIDDAGGRSVATIVVLLTALAVAVVALVPTFRSGIINWMSGGRY